MAHSHNYWQEDLVPYYVDFSIVLSVLPHDIAAGFPQSGQGRSYNAFYDLVSEVTRCHFCYSIIRSELLSPAYIWES